MVFGICVYIRCVKFDVIRMPSKAITRGITRLNRQKMESGQSRHVRAVADPLGRNFVGRAQQSFFLLVLWVFGIGMSFSAVSRTAELPLAEPQGLRSFFKSYCFECHRGSDAEAGLDVFKLGSDLSSRDTMAHWVRIFDRVQHGEMPPRDADKPGRDEAAAFLKSISPWLSASQERDYQQRGRVQARRLTNLQLERSLHDLLGIDIPLANQFPDEPRTHGYTTVAVGQPMSHFQLEQHLNVVDMALDEAFRRAVSEPDEFKKHLNAKELSRRNARSRNREPELLDDRGVVWSSRLIFYGRLPVTTARESGWYRLKIRASSLKSPGDHGVWCSVRTGFCVSGAPLLGWAGAFEAKDKSQEWTFEAWLPKGEMFEVRPGDTTLKMARFQGGQVGAGEGGPQNVPGVAIEWIEFERLHRGPDNAVLRQQLFGKLKINTHKDWRQAIAESDVPKEEVRKLVTQFAGRAFRRPVTAAQAAPYVQMAIDALDQGESLMAALRAGYRAVLCSPRFLYFNERPGVLDDYAAATRLSYFLWNRMPDAELLRLASTGELRKPDQLRAQVRRMLADSRGKDFVRDFAAQWLDLSLIDFTEPDPRLYRTFDIVVQQSMLDETHAYLQTMLDQNLSVTHVIDSDFTFLNSRLARFYGVKGVDRDQLQRVSLAPDSPRGGLLGQGAILKVTANGTTTSPVIRGVWVSERLLGEEVPPPPANVPAIEPDIRGAKSIRDMLAKHRSIESCAVCHTKIDPPGFALENFDPAGSWRERYGSSGGKGAPVDSNYTLPDGRPFKDVNGYRAHIIGQPDKLARNVARQLLTYGTGAPVGFADRAAVDRIVEETRSSKYGFASLVEAVVMSRTFLRK